MSINKQEDVLFDRWKQKYASFVIDGIPFEKDYLHSRIKTIFVLKDANAPDINGELDLRTQLRTEPHPWWNTVATWCAGISQLGEELPWNVLHSEDDDYRTRSDRLKGFGFVQLKKSCGGGFLSGRELWAHAQDDSEMITAQLAIYEPHIIVGAGVGSVLCNILGSRTTETTARGVSYSIHYLTPKHPSYLLHYVHPSVRAPKSIVCYGLLDAYLELSKKVLRDSL